MSKEYSACVYARLSRDDGDKSESDSIVNQKALIRDFLKKYPEIHIVSEKADDGFSGVSFDRPAFKEMMDEIHSGKVNCVVVKDLSRFGRNYIEAGNYIEKVFPFLGVRFIAINDHYDSLERGQADSLIIPFKNLINDSYSKDISVKIRSQFEIKRKKGEYVGAFVVYGYLKDPENKNRLIVDPYASEIVRSIFRWKTEGMSQSKIADRLNAEGVLSPLEYKHSLGIRMNRHFQVNRQAQWSPVAIDRILKNEIYTGVLIQGRRTTPNYKVKKVILKDQSEWVRIENAHEAIIDRSTFDNVQDTLARDIRTAPEQEVVYALSGYVKCADCRQNMIRKSYQRKGRRYTYLVCSTHKSTKGCSTHSISFQKLEQIVLQAVREQIAAVMEAARMIEVVDSLPEQQRGILNYDAQVVRLKEEIERCEGFKLKLYENLQQGVISQEEYFLFKKSYTDKIEGAKKSIQKLQEEREELLDNSRERFQWMDVFKRYANLQELDREAVVELIEAVYVYSDKKVEVSFRYADEYSKVMRMLEAVSPQSQEA